MTGEDKISGFLACIIGMVVISLSIMAIIAGPMGVTDPLDLFVFYVFFGVMVPTIGLTILLGGLQEVRE